MVGTLGTADILSSVREEDDQSREDSRRRGRTDAVPEAARDSAHDADAGQTNRSTVNRHHERLLGEPPSYTIDEFAAAAGVEVGVARQYWRSLGFPDVPREERWFTSADVAALKNLAETVNAKDVSVRAAQDLVRGLGHSMDRLVLWQVEALVQDASSRFDLDDVSARLVVLDRLVDLSPLLREQLDYVWRRQLLALLGRIDRDLSRAGTQPGAGEQLPLERAIGFIDIVSYTTRSADLSPSGLASLVQDFESAARDVVARYGGRVVKTIGDAVLFVADDLPAGARVATALARVMGGQDLPVRGAVVWGRLLSRSGDVFGPVVNLASRLTDLAAPHEILMDDVSAALLEGLPAGREFIFDHRAAAEVEGLGQVRPVEVQREPSSARE